MNWKDAKSTGALPIGSSCVTYFVASFMSCVLLGIGLAGAVAAGDGSATLDAGNAELSLAIEGLLESGQPLNVRLVTALGAVQRATAVAPAEMTATVSGRVVGRNLSVAFRSPGRTGGTLNLEMTLDGRKVSGSYNGTWNRADVKGTVSGTAAPGKGILEGEPQPPLELVKASYFGTAENDNFEGAAAGPDGCLYLVGNAGVPIRELPGGAVPLTLGSDVAAPLCGCGFVMKLSADASEVLAYAQLGKGILHATAVAVTDKAVYVGGYASDALEPLLKERRGLLIEYPLRTEQKLIQDGKMLEANGLPADKPDPHGLLDRDPRRPAVRADVDRQRPLHPGGLRGQRGGAHEK